MTQGYEQLSLLEKSNPGFMQNLYNTAKSNIGETGAGLSRAGKATLGGLKAGAKWVGKASPYAGAGITAIDAARSFQIANELENMKKLYQDIPQEAIDFYRNKGKAISAGAGVGGIGGGIMGSGVFSAPGAALGIGLGGMAGGGLYNLSQLKNRYKDYYNSPEYQKILQDYNGTLKGGGTSSSTSTGGKGSNGTGGQSTTQAQAQALAQQLSGNAPVVNQQDADTQQANIQAINDYVSRLQEINQPYIESLQRFADNYGDLYNQNQLYNRRMRDLSAITGSPLWYQSAKDYNPLEVEATKVDLQKKIQDAQAGDINAINDIMGNLAVAQEMGLPPEAAFANKNLLTAMTMRDKNLTNKEIAELNNAAKMQIALQNYANRLAVQNLRNQGGLQNALVWAGQYGQQAPGLTQGGSIPMMFGGQTKQQPISAEGAYFQKVLGK